MTTSPAIHAALIEPFEPEEVKWKPQSVRGNRALAIAYIDARAVMDRLDEVIGPENWSDHYEVLSSGSVKCRLIVRFKDGNYDVWHEDVGSESEQPDGGDRLKAAFSDALKRAAVKFGIGRYLYRLKQQWVDYDPTKKMFTSVPGLPDWAKPKPKPAPTLSVKQRAVVDEATSKKIAIATIVKAYNLDSVFHMSDEQCDDALTRLARK